MRTILSNIDPIVTNDSNESQDSDSGSENDDSLEDNGSGGSNTISDEELQDMIDSKSIVPSTPDENLGNDDGSDCVELSDRQKRMLEKAFEKQEKFLDGDVQKTKLSKKENNNIKVIEESGATYQNVGDGIDDGNWRNYGSGKGTKCLVVKNLTKNLIDSNVFNCASSWNFGRYNTSSSDY